MLLAESAIKAESRDRLRADEDVELLARLHRLPRAVALDQRSAVRPRAIRPHARELKAAPGFGIFSLNQIRRSDRSRTELRDDGGGTGRGDEVATVDVGRRPLFEVAQFVVSVLTRNELAFLSVYMALPDARMTSKTTEDRVPRHD